MTRRIRAAAKAPATDRGADGAAMLCRPSRPVETAVAGIVATQTLDNHLIDRMANASQLTGRQPEAAQRLLEMCDAAGLMPGGCATYGRVGREGMTDTMAEARARWNNMMKAVGAQKADLLTSLCHERHPGIRWLGTLQAALTDLANHWKLGN